MGRRTSATLVRVPASSEQRFRRRSRRGRRNLPNVFQSATTWLRRIAFLGAAVALLVFGVRYVSALGSRTIPICVATDASYRLQTPDASIRLIERFQEINKLFDGSNVTWAPTYSGEAYPDSVRGDLQTRRDVLASSAECKADVVIGFSGTGEPSDNRGVAPFEHALLIAENASQPEAMKAAATARALATLFGVATDSRALVDGGSPAGFFDAAAKRQISDLRGYNFKDGVRSLRGRWEDRAAVAMIRAFAGRTVHPAVEAHRVLARAFASARMYPQSIAHMKAAVREDPGNASLHMELALSLQNEEDTDAALAELSQAAKLDGSDARPHAFLGALYMRQGRPYDAIAELRQATSLDPRSAGYQNALARALLLQVGRNQEARAALEQALRADPHYADAFEAVGAISGMETSAADQLEHARSALRLAPSSPDAYIDLGRAEIGAGNVEAARKAFIQALALNSTQGDAHIALARLDFDAGQYDSADHHIEAARKAGARIPIAFADALQRRIGPSVGVAK